MPKPHAPRSGRARRQKYGPAVMDTHLGQHRLVRAVEYHARTARERGVTPVHRRSRLLNAHRDHAGPCTGTRARGAAPPLQPNPVRSLDSDLPLRATAAIALPFHYGLSLPVALYTFWMSVSVFWQEDLTFGLLQSYLGQRLPDETRSPIRRSG